MAEKPNPTGYTYSLCGCFGDCSVCCLTWFCPMQMVARNKAEVDNRQCTLCDYCFAVPCIEYFTRQQIRARFQLPQSACADCCAVWCCFECAICQDSREIALRNRAAK